MSRLKNEVVIVACTNPKVLDAFVVLTAEINKVLNESKLIAKERFEARNKILKELKRKEW